MITLIPACTVAAKGTDPTSPRCQSGKMDDFRPERQCGNVRNPGVPRPESKLLDQANTGSIVDTSVNFSQTSLCIALSGRNAGRTGSTVQAASHLFQGDAG